MFPLSRTHSSPSYTKKTNPFPLQQSSGRSRRKTMKSLSRIMADWPKGDKRYLRPTRNMLEGKRQIVVQM